MVYYINKTCKSKCHSGDCGLVWFAPGQSLLDQAAIPQTPASGNAAWPGSYLPGLEPNMPCVTFLNNLH